MIVKLILTEASAKKPERSTFGAAGYDLFSAKDYVIQSGDKLLVSTGVKMEIPFGWFGRICPRSGLTLKKFIDVGGGIIDSDYRGDIGVILFNFGNHAYVIKTGDRIAQMLFQKYETPEFLEGEELSKTERDTDGFGSSEK